jgi:peptidoglycan hydrolase-like protein with peptidoglycan-binding domain
MAALDTHTALPAPSEDGVAPPPAPDTDRPLGRRARPWLIGAGVLALTAGAVGVYLAGSGDGDDGATAEDVPRRAVEATQGDLVEFTELDGTLTYPTISGVTAGASGTVTAVAEDGDVVDRGSVLYEVDAEPVVVLYGGLPAYRPLAEGDEGDDVLQLEENLASLGHHAELDEDDGEIDGGFVADGVFDAATTDAVLRWQEAVGLEQTGVVAPDDVVFVSGPAVVSDVAVDVGSAVQPGVPVASLNVAEGVGTFHSAHSGEVDLVAGAREPLGSGQVLYTVDGDPILAVVSDADVELERDLSLGVANGEDVEVVEQMLVDAGFDADGSLDVDEEFDEVTEEAIEDLWESLDGDYDVEVTGTIGADQLVLVPTDARVEVVTEHDSDVLATGAELFSWTVGTDSRLVTTEIGVDEQDRLAEGDAVDVELPDGTVVGGVVTQVAVSSTVDPTDPTAEAVLPVEITLDEVPESVAGLNELQVEVLVVDQLVTDAVIVPVTALVATGDGGYAVEVVGADGATTSFVAVEPGMFADGSVEVTGIEPGTAVVVPR